MSPPILSDEAQRTAALAFWRYAHDYLRAAQTFGSQHKVASADSHVPYHVAAQGLEFALKAYLRAKDVSPSALRLEVGHSLVEAMNRCVALGLPPLPANAREAIEAIAPYHQQDRFQYFACDHDEFPRLDPLVLAGLWILEHAAEDVAAHYVKHHAAPASPSVVDFVRRLRADLSATSGKLQTSQPLH